MKDELNKIEVNIREVNIVENNEAPEPTATKFAEWHAPAGSSLYSADANECCITGMTDKAYAIHFGLLPDFDAKGYPSVSVSILIDGKIKAGYPVSIPKFKKLHTKEKDFTYHSNGTKNKDGKRIKHPFTFDSTRLKDPNNIGSIVVKVQRTTATFIGGTNGGTYVRKDAKLEEEQEFIYKFFYASTATLRSLGILIPQKLTRLVIPPVNMDTNASAISKSVSAVAKPQRHRSHAETDDAATQRTAIPSGKSMHDSASGLNTPASAAPRTPSYVAPSANMTPSTPKSARTPSVASTPNHFLRDFGVTLEEAASAICDLPPVTATPESSGHLFSPTLSPFASGGGLPYTPSSTAVPAIPGFTGSGTFSSKRKSSAAESVAAASHQHIEESPLAKKTRMSLPGGTATPPSTRPLFNSSNEDSKPSIKVESQTAAIDNDDDEVVCIGNRNRHEEQKKKDERYKLALEALEAEEQYELEEVRIKAAMAKKKLELRKKHLLGDD